MATVPDYYRILEVSREASQDEIRRAYHQKAKLFHPDIYKGLDGDLRFKMLNEAYRILNSPEKRKRYDFKLKYGTIIEYKSRADYDRERRSGINREILRRRQEQAKREYESLRKRFRIFDKFIFWSLFTIGSAGVIFGIVDVIINFHFTGILVSIVLILILIFAYKRFRNK